MSFGDRVRARRKALGLTQEALSRAIRGLGGELSQQQITAIETGLVARPRALPELATALKTTVDYLLQGVGGPEIDAELPPSNAQFAKNAPPPPYRDQMPKDVPVMGTGVGGDVQGDFELNGQIVDHVRRPPRLAGRRDVFALYLQGTSMIPWREPGNLVYLEGARAPRAGDHVVVELKPTNGDDVRPALVKKLLAITPTRLKLQQYNPAKVFEIERVKVLRIHRVMDWDEMMGV